MNHFLASTPIIIVSALFSYCQFSKIRKEPLLPEPIQNLYILPTIHSGVIRWKVILDWTSPPSGRLKIYEGSEAILDTEIDSRVFIGNPVSRESTLFRDPEKDSKVEWIVEWTPPGKKSIQFRLERILSAELKTSIQKYLTNL